MILLVHEIVTGGSYLAKFTPDANKAVKTICPHLLRVGAPAGTVKLQITNHNGDPIASTNTRNITSLGTGTNFHGYCNFDLDFHMRAGVEYGVKLVTTGYTLGASYLAWANGFDLGSYEGTYENVSTLGYSAPLDIKCWVERLVQKGVP